MAFLEERLCCPSCDEDVDDVWWFQWGYCARSDFLGGVRYLLGDSVHWKSGPSRTPTAQTAFERSHEKTVSKGHTANLGYPDWVDVDVQEFRTAPDPMRCSNCGSLFAGVLRVRNNILAQVHTFVAKDVPDVWVKHLSPTGQVLEENLGNDQLGVTEPRSLLPPALVDQALGSINAAFPDPSWEEQGILLVAATRVWSNLVVAEAVARKLGLDPDELKFRIRTAQRTGEYSLEDVQALERELRSALHSLPVKDSPSRQV